ncbi:MAG: UDP-3-O-[3-hydroxymyristoyl] N-acetylglucosamine deacetylase [SAR324 cluster bacterium]|uniref:UDP-3-O-acyl-N-acetylglucosamine deacetylase n=1 Tax=SAR324 cluster bacterium TaxID=2024889 RepID=A0A2A4SW62_9DELT|nr:MAG: UDP-3-O-[3-hydroxymyristoyl] N-acetylglucosamine deacetylase [SAR324 cluster bacterium]
MNQTTINETCLLNGGVGLHSGIKSNLCFHPAPADHGIVFLRSDKQIEIPATYRYAKPTPLCTTLEREGVIVETIEHLLSVCNGMGIDNLLVELETIEIPIFDGSGYNFYKKLSQAGIRQLAQPKKVIRILEPITFQQGEIMIYVTPATAPSFTFSIDFDHPQIGQQEFSFNLTESNYSEQIVRAKTFCLEKDIPKMKELGLVKGGREDNAIILDKRGQFKNLDIMTWLNEPNLHKILDQVGDFYLADNYRIIGNVFSHKSGHSSHLAFIRYLMDECQDKYEVVELT